MKFKKAMFVLCVIMILLGGCSSPDDKKQAFIEKGDELFAQKDYVKARLEYKNAVQIDPKFGKAYYLLGKTELELKNFKQAYGMFLKAVEQDPDNLDARVSLGKLLLAGKAIDKAEEQADAILSRQADHVEGNLLKASIYFIHKNYELGSEILQTLLQERCQQCRSLSDAGLLVSGEKRSGGHAAISE